MILGYMDGDTIVNKLNIGFVLVFLAYADVAI
jgi:hypothetical protein